jgi:hypothetical protein
VETNVGIKLPETDLKTVQGSIELKDERGEHVGQYFFGKGQGRTVFPFGKYKGTFKTHAECQAFIDGVTAVIDDNRGSRCETSTSVPP